MKAGARSGQNFLDAGFPIDAQPARNAIACRGFRSLNAQDKWLSLALITRERQICFRGLGDGSSPAFKIVRKQCNIG
jgi:hypothetical protein